MPQILLSSQNVHPLLMYKATSKRPHQRAQQQPAEKTLLLPEAPFLHPAPQQRSRTTPQGRASAIRSRAGIDHGEGGQRPERG